MTFSEEQEQKLLQIEVILKEHFEQLKDFAIQNLFKTGRGAIVAELKESSDWMGLRYAPLAEIQSGKSQVHLSMKKAIEDYIPERQIVILAGNSASSGLFVLECT
ncbi:hypothetical protein [Chroococcidiopsis sp.]|uniref:hypothetical protein n=1 Tax=Chroococcidiopsis sp. TaxID=3088168 RepID=UPI003F3F70A0